MKGKRPIFAAVLTAIAWLALGATAVQAAEEPMGIPVYDEASYSAFVESKMKELDALYLQFCATCGVEAEQAARARMEFLTSVRELMEYMNGRFDSIVSPNQEILQLRLDLLGTPEEHKRQILYDAGHFPYPQHLFKKDLSDWLEEYL